MLYYCNHFFTTTLTSKCCECIFQICVRGRNIFMGYLNQEEKTREVFDEEGFFKSGDTGRIDSNGFLFVTGRIKGDIMMI